MVVPPYLRGEIEKGNVVLFLGAGASMEATGPTGNGAPSGKRLGELIAEKFLDGKFADYPLAQIAEFAINEIDLVTVQTFIRGIFDPLRPTRSHELISTFRWRSIATTNYDQVMERAYDSSTAAQTLVPFVKDGDRIDDRMREVNALEYLKLHGCITHITDAECPLILTTDQYIQHRKSRHRIFARFKERACEKPVVFVGCQLQDPDLRAILLELEETLESRPRYFIVTPNVDDVEVRFWEQKKITCLRGTLSEFTTALDRDISATFRGLRKTTALGPLAIAERFVTSDTVVSESTRIFLESDADYVGRLSRCCVMLSNR